MKIAVVTDSNCGLVPAQGEKYGIYILPMPFQIGEKEYLEGVSLDRATFFEKQKGGENITTSQPSLSMLMELWDKLLAEYEAVIHIPMSSSLSSSCQNAIALARDENYEGKVFVVDNHRISYSQWASALDAKKLIERGSSPQEIVQILEKESLEATIYLTVDTLKYLKKGGRITAAAAAIGTLLRIKPVLTIQGAKIDSFSKVRTARQAKEAMFEAVQKDVQNRWKSEKEVDWFVAHSDCLELAQEFSEEVSEKLGKKKVIVFDLALSVATHVGPGTLVLGAVKRI